MHLLSQCELPHSAVSFQEEIEAIDLYVFGDTSGSGTATVMYAEVYQKSGINQGLLLLKQDVQEKA